ncbi:hypothetical protein R3P38DRAFT_2801048 [Favolaschia claudopus]|uniref:Uncharacterized protein n=1 Tax=Favolaschia claudopus TaxID=2862362 RepID=A0AAV9ZW68_9AGAR
MQNNISGISAMDLRYSSATQQAELKFEVFGHNIAECEKCLHEDKAIFCNFEPEGRWAPHQFECHLDLLIPTPVEIFAKLCPTTHFFWFSGADFKRFQVDVDTAVASVVRRRSDHSRKMLRVLSFLNGFLAGKTLSRTARHRVAHRSLPGRTSLQTHPYLRSSVERDASFSFFLSDHSLFEFDPLLEMAVKETPCVQADWELKTVDPGGDEGVEEEISVGTRRGGHILVLGAALIIHGKIYSVYIGYFVSCQQQQIKSRVATHLRN